MKKFVPAENNTLSLMQTFISDNPFYIIGAFSNDKLKTINSNANKIRAYTKISKPITFDLDLTSFINVPVRTKQSVDNALSKINFETDNLFYRLFWLWNVSVADQKAISALMDNNLDKAISVLKDRSNFSAYINLSVLYILKGDLYSYLHSVLKFFCNTDIDIFNSFIDYANGNLNSQISYTFKETLFSRYISEIAKKISLSDLIPFMTYLQANDNSLDLDILVNEINRIIINAKIIEIKKYFERLPEFCQFGLNEIYKNEKKYYSKFRQLLDDLLKLLDNDTADEQYRAISTKLSLKLHSFPHAVMTLLFKGKLTFKPKQKIFHMNNTRRFLSHCLDLCVDDDYRDYFVASLTKVDARIKEIKDIILFESLIWMINNCNVSIDNLCKFTNIAIPLYQRIVDEHCRGYYTHRMAELTANTVTGVILNNIDQTVSALCGTCNFDEIKKKILRLIKIKSLLNTLYSSIIKIGRFLPDENNYNSFIRFRHLLNSVFNDLPEFMFQYYTYAPRNLEDGSGTDLCSQIEEIMEDKDKTDSSDELCIPEYNVFSILTTKHEMERLYLDILHKLYNALALDDSELDDSLGFSEGSDDVNLPSGTGSSQADSTSEPNGNPDIWPDHDLPL